MCRFDWRTTGGRIRIEVFSAGAFVRPFEGFDAVGAGVADMYHSFEGYFEKKSPAFHFFAAIPFGFTANELFAWVHYGGGQELWDALSGQFNIKSLLCTSTGCQMGGWFTREVTSPDGFKGLRYRMAGPGAEVLRRLGAIVVTLPGGEIMPALRSGAIDASEWIGPWLDMAIGLHKTVGYYYYPGFHEPGTAHSLGINKGVWESFTPSDRRFFETVAACEYSRSLGGVQRQQRAVAAQAQGRRHRADPEVRRVPPEAVHGDRQRGRRGDRIARRTLETHLRELPGVPRLDHGLERRRRGRIHERAPARLDHAF